jgi:hypothetical protein
VHGWNGRSPTPVNRQVQGVSGDTMTDFKIEARLGEQCV